MDMQVTLLIFGILLFLVGIIGKVKAKELEVGTTNAAARLILVVIGVAFIYLSIKDYVVDETTDPTPTTPPVVETTTIPPTTQPPPPTTQPPPPTTQPPPPTTQPPPPTTQPPPPTTPPTPAIPPGVVEGRVLWNERPVAGADVYVRDEYSFDSTHYGAAKTDANGYFSISGVPEGKQYLYVFGNQPEFWVTGVTPFTMESGKGTSAEDTYLCKGFNPVWPENNQTINTSRPTLQWNEYSGAVDYAVRVIRVGQSGFIFQRGDNDARIRGTNVQVNIDLSNGEYRWRVDAFNSQGHIIGCSYFPRSFTVDD